MIRGTSCCSSKASKWPCYGFTNNRNCQMFVSQSIWRLEARRGTWWSTFSTVGRSDVKSKNLKWKSYIQAQEQLIISQRPWSTLDVIRSCRAHRSQRVSSLRGIAQTKQSETTKTELWLGCNRTTIFLICQQSGVSRKALLNYRTERGAGHGSFRCMKATD